MDDTRIGFVTSTDTTPRKPQLKISPTHTTHSHNVFELHYLYSGTFHMHLGEQLITLHQGQALIIAPDVYHYYESFTPDAATMVKQFTLEPIPHRRGTLYQKFAGTFLNPEGFCILDADTDLFDRLRKLHENGNLHEDSAVRYRAILEMIFLDLCRPVSMYEKPPLPDADSVVRAYEISEYVSKYFAEDITADDMAAYLSISRRQLFRCLRDTMHTSWTELLTKQRIQYAIQLLIEGFSPTAAASACGYRSYNGFVKAFLREQHMTPAEFKTKRSLESGSYNS